MKFLLNHQIFAFLFVLSTAFFSFGCQSGAATGSGAATPTDAYKQLYAAVKAKNTESIKAQMSKQTLAFADTQAKNSKQTLDQMLVNGLTATTFASSLPTMRDERIKDASGAVEVWNSKDSRWEDLPFVNENGWKLAVGEEFGGTFKSPGKGRAQLESEANSANMTPVVPSNGNQPNINGAKSAANQAK